MKDCPAGQYYCTKSKKCKPIPKGYHVMRSGYLTKDEDDGQKSKKNGNGNGNGRSGTNGSSSGNGNGNGNGSNGGGNGGGMSEGSLHKWFKGSKSKDGKGGWVNVVTGGTCASDEPGEGTPKCVSSAKRASMTKAQRLSASRRKKAADPGQQSKRGAAKPTYVKTDSKKKMKESKDLNTIAKELDKAVVMHKSQAKRIRKHAKDMEEACWKGYEKKGMKTMFGKRYPNCVKKTKKEEVENVTEADKKGKGSGTKDACYHKVKSRYSVWPSAYASGALVKCRKVGAANWGNSSKKEEVEYKTFNQFYDECWKTHKKVGMKMKGGKMVADCRPKNEEVEIQEKSAAWQRKEGKNKSGGLNEKGRKSYERENPGSDLKAPQPEGGPRKRSFCARMGGMKGPMKDEKGRPTRKALALRKWKC